MSNQNCITYWLPKLIEAGLPVPKTKIVTTSAPLCVLCDGDTPDGWRTFLDEMLEAVREIGTPCFLRTGHTSDKHNWKNTCYIAEADTSLVGQHVFNLVEFSEIYDLPSDVWAVRELLPTTPRFYAFRGCMPIVREFRFFVRDAKVTCFHPYWPPKSIRDASVDDWGRRLAGISVLGIEFNHVCSLATRAGEAVGGEWSVDVLETTRGWYVTDMAAAQRSYHWPSCKYAEVPA